VPKLGVWANVVGEVEAEERYAANQKRIVLLNKFGKGAETKYVTWMAVQCSAWNCSHGDNQLITSDPERQVRFCRPMKHIDGVKIVGRP
jgi:hypothetical protein